MKQSKVVAVPELGILETAVNLKKYCKWCLISNRVSSSNFAICKNEEFKDCYCKSYTK